MSVGCFTQSIFHTGGMQAFSCTLTGNVVVMDVLRSGKGQLCSIEATKLIPLQKDGITVMTWCDRYTLTHIHRLKQAEHSLSFFNMITINVEIVFKNSKSVSWMINCKFAAFLQCSPLLHKEI